MLEKTTATTRAGVNGAVIAARSENDTGNNPHNPMYGIAKAGARGELLTLIGSQNSDSGGNSMAPAMLMDPANRPTKIDRASRCERPGRHRRARHAVHESERHAGHGLDRRGHGADGPHQRAEAPQGRPGDRATARAWKPR